LSETRPAPVPRGRAFSAGSDADGWEALAALVRYRLLIAAITLPLALQFGPDAPSRSPWILAGALLAVGVGSTLFAVALRARRGLSTQIYAQLVVDILVVTALAALTGAQGSQFVMIYILVILSGGFIGGVPAGLATACLACAAFLALPALVRTLALPDEWANAPRPSSTSPALFIVFLVLLGALTGYLGQRIHSTHESLAQTRRELLRVRLDTDKILQHLTTGVLTIDESANVIYLNRAGEEVLELAAIDVRGTPCQEALEGRLAALHERLLHTLRSGKTDTRVELSLRRRNGQPLPVGCTTNVLSDRGTLTGVVAVFQDLSEVREMERRVRRSETLAAVGELAARIAHEFRNGLKPISGSVECLQRELRLKGENKRLMQLIATESDRLNRFVSELLSYSRDPEIVPVSFDLREALDEVSELAQRDPRRREGTRIRLEGNEPSVHIVGDREQLRQVWLNLVANALEAMEKGGTLTVRTRQVGGGVHVEFIDDGLGIAAEDLPRVGQPFFTTKQSGTGLGIAIAQRIVERHGGHLSLESSLGRGTVARVTLPRERVQVPIAA
jgi:two-component system sensor histidine kinase PilS (NtrC family)